MSVNYFEKSQSFMTLIVSLWIFDKIFTFGLNLKSSTCLFPAWGAQVECFPFAMAWVGFFSEGIYTGWRREWVSAGATETQNIWWKQLFKITFLSLVKTFLNFKRRGANWSNWNVETSEDIPPGGVFLWNYLLRVL